MSADKTRYEETLEAHDDDTGRLLLPRGLELATCPEGEIPKVHEKDRTTLAQEREISREVARRKDPKNYAHLWGKSLREVEDEMTKIGRPLAPQAIEALDSLLEGYEPSRFDEHLFVETEGEADARLYRDQRLRAGLTGTLEQRVIDYRS